MVRIALKVPSKLLIDGPFAKLVADILRARGENLDLQLQGGPWLKAPAKLRDLTIACPSDLAVAIQTQKGRVALGAAAQLFAALRNYLGEL